MAEFDVQVRLPREFQQGDIIEVKLKIKHPSRTGLQLVEDSTNSYERFIRNQPAEYVRQVDIFYDEEPINVFKMNAAIADDPLIIFKLKVDKAAPLRILVEDHLRETVEVTEDIQFS